MLFNRQKTKSSIPQCVQGVKHYRQGDYRNAAEALESYTQRDDLLGQTASYYYTLSCRALGLQAMHREAFAEAEEWLRRAVDTTRGDADISTKLATIYARTDRPHQCAEAMQTAYHRRPEASAGNRLALAQWRAGGREQAMITLIDDLRRSTPSAAHYRQLALLSAGDNDYPEAARWLEQAIQADCSDWRSWRYKGLVATATGDLTEAVRCFHRAADLQPGNLEVLWQLSRTAAAAGEAGQKITLSLPEESMPVEETPIRHLANYIAFEPDYLDACLHLPMDTEPERYYTMLQSVVAMAIVMHPDHPELHYHQSRIHLRLGQMDHAIEHAALAVKLDPTYKQAWLHLAKLYTQVGQKEQAIVALRRTINNGGDWPDVHHLLGELYRGRHRKNAARRCYHRALTLNPQYHLAAEGLEKLAA